tara:strand:- start:1478 stop:2200 length:723 start_codon:yes stop_codon:yes gene_type:complete
MESWDFDPPGVDVLEWAFNYLSENSLIDAKQIETGFPKNRLIDDGEDRKLVYLSGTVCEDVNLILRHGEIITELREEVQFGKYDVTIVGKSQKRNMSHDLIQYINSSILVVNEYDDENFNRVLLPVDNFPGSMKAAKYAIRVALSYDVGINILNVLDENKSKNEDSSNVSKIIKLIRRSGVDHKYIKEDGDPVEKIIEKSNNDKIIVMRASNMSPIKRYFQGSKPLSVMNSCNVPILIVK